MCPEKQVVMKKQRRPFRMKQFEVSDARSGNKVGVDGVLLGSWVEIPSGCSRIADIGCGCGIIALMLAQRSADSKIIGIEVEPLAAEEASENAIKSPFKEIIEILNIDFETLIQDINAGNIEPMNLLVSNPPFFASGGNPKESERMLARHAGTLSPEILLAKGAECLTQTGMLAFIAPFEFLDRYLKLADKEGWTFLRGCIVRGNPDVPPKRVMLQFVRNSKEIIRKPDMQTLTIENSRGDFTSDYLALGRPFYLKF